MRKEVLIAGGGIIGLCTAWQLIERGAAVTIVDREDAGHAGCSWGNAGMVVPSHFVPLAAPGMVRTALRMMASAESPFYIQPRLDWDLLAWMCRFYRSARAAHVARSAPILRDLHLASRALYQQLSEDLGHSFGLTSNGLLMLCKTEYGRSEESRAAEQARSLGIDARPLGAREVAQLEPDISMNVAGGVLYPMDCHLAPARLMHALREKLTAAGVRFAWHTKITGWRVRERRVQAAETSDGEIAADQYVLCAGSWSQQLARQLGLNLPMQAGKGYSLTLPTPRQTPRACAILAEARVAVTPMNGSLRFGGTMELAGLDERINRRRIQGIIRSACAYYPAFTPDDFAALSPWAGLRPCSPDGLPYLGRTRRIDNLTIATGHAMMGISLAPITGTLAAKLVFNEELGMDLSPLDPGRFG